MLPAFTYDPPTRLFRQSLNLYSCEYCNKSKGTGEAPKNPKLIPKEGPLNAGGSGADGQD